MTDREKYKQAFSVLHTSEKFSLEEKKMAKLKRQKTIKNIAAAIIVCLLFVGGSGTAYANDLCGIQRKLQIWIEGNLTDAQVTFNGDGSYKMEYTRPDGSSAEIGGGGIAFDKDGENARPLTPDELQEDIEEVDYIDFRDDGTIWFVYRGEKTEITHKFKNGFCHVEVRDENNKPVYYTIRQDGAYSSSPNKYIDEKDFEE